MIPKHLFCTAKLAEQSLNLLKEALGKPPHYRTTTNVRLGFLRKILSQISKLTSYIRKRCTKLPKE